MHITTNNALSFIVVIAKTQCDTSVTNSLKPVKHFWKFTNDYALHLHIPYKILNKVYKV